MIEGQDIYGKGVDAVRVRRHIGMVFQKPNPFPKSIYDNVAFGPKLAGMDDLDVYSPGIDVVAVRRAIGMVFQKPNPFPKSIYDNIAFGPRVLGMKGSMDEIVEHALRQGALWDEVKDRLKTNAFGMSGGQQQRLCIARCLAVEPDVILMDEPCSALDPISTGKIEDLMMDLKQEYSIVIVTHNMQQAARVSDKTAFFTVTPEDRVGTLVEFDDTEKIFTNPTDPRTEAYVTGKVG